MKDKRTVYHAPRALALALALTMLLTLGAPARAGGLFDWLLGPSATEAAAVVTLPPADRMPIPQDVEAETPVPEITLAPIPEAALKDDGVLRVLLASLSEPQQLHLTLAGVYAVDGDPGFRFDRDARVALSLAEGRVYLSVGGLTIDMGASVTLTRHKAADGAENGIYIDESEKRTLYCGDLKVSAEQNGLKPVLSIHAEDYLYGVVAYEMSDSFPIEALKAQAVAARTYAMQRKWQAGSRDYDLVDTTADQVFKGYDPAYQNVVRAVDDTRGVVGLYDGAFAVCYYTASNGGQTALASQIWKTSGSDGYLAMEDDPFDLENPRSLQNDLTVTARCEGSAALKAMLEQALGERLAADGYKPGEWEFESIASVTPMSPRFEGSRMYEQLEFGLRARLLKPVATPTPVPTDTPAPEPTDTPAPAPTGEADALAAIFTGEETQAPTAEPTEVPREWVLSDEIYTVTLSVYDQIKDKLSLGLNGSDCELISVQTQTDAAGDARAFTLIMRRFGHGVGMSQRGAQWMAGHYGMNWQQIIAFYYPGLSVERMAWPEGGLTELDALPDSVGAARPKPTPTPTPAPLPELKEGERYATVTATALNVREQPTTAARVVDRLPKGRRLIVSSEADEDGWVAVHTAEIEGYVKEEYLVY